ncbi:hypothetical protein IV203_004135 [Nitzschia inconspicua]|uniref:DUF6824 domain-containing protein n=1 Tax=Nitzschia inconspicua TaxID=303405 RepID=A0A9K3PRM3_9STRA|nr:hypothetical protein IV203_004135 [Nitzschia inconspicua]
MSQISAQRAPPSSANIEIVAQNPDVMQQSRSSSQRPLYPCSARHDCVIMRGETSTGEVNEVPTCSITSGNSLPSLNNFSQTHLEKSPHLIEPNNFARHVDERMVCASAKAIADGGLIAWDNEIEDRVSDSIRPPKPPKNCKKTKIQDDNNQDWLDSSSFSSMSSLDDLENLVVAQQDAVTVELLKETKKGSVNHRDETGLSHLTQALNQMTMADREKALFDLHGVSGNLPEHDIDQVETWLWEMNHRLSQHARDHPGLAKAIELNEGYVLQERIKFLRSDEYDPVKAAERMAFYFDMKHDYFCGPSSHNKCFNDGIEECSCLVRDLTIHDLTEEDLRYWRTGFYQVCQEKDRAGRIVCIVFLPLCYRLKIPPESMVRVYLVMNTILTQNVEVQKSGNVHIAYAVGLGEDSLNFIGSDHFANSVVKAGRYAPLRGVAKHFCYDHDSLHPMFGKYAKPMATYNAVRFRSHFGTHAEVLYNLMTFGISSTSLPISDSGAVQTEFHNGFIDSLLRQQQQRDEQLKRHILRCKMESERMVSLQCAGIGRFKGEHLSESIGWRVSEDESRTLESTPNGVLSLELVGMEVPRSDAALPILALNATDVILGRGNRNRRNVGNLRLKLLVEKHFTEYNAPSTTRAGKTAIVNKILKQMQDAGSRFVVAVRDDDTISDSFDMKEASYRRWFLAPDEKVRDKISHDFRNMKRTGNSNAQRSEIEKGYSEDWKRIAVDQNRALTQSTQEIGSSRSATPDSSVNKADEAIITPGERDILMGRANKKSNLGHALLRRALNDHYEEYEAANQGKVSAATNLAKTSIVLKVLERTGAGNVRFLIPTPDGYWTLAPREKIHDKITQDFRNLRWAKKNKESGSF